MRVKIVKMGNSRGIRLPKPILEASGLSDEVELKVEGETIVLTPPHKNPREGWAEAFAALPPDDEDWSDWQKMRNGFDDTEWTWPEDHVWPEDPNDVYLVDLEPVRGSEIARRRPCAIVSPQEANAALRTVTVVPLTSTRRRYPLRVPTTFSGVNGEAATDQIRSVDKQRLVRLVGRLDRAEAQALCRRLVEMFAY